MLAHGALPKNIPLKQERTLKMPRISLRTKNFLTGEELSSHELSELLNLAQFLKDHRAENPAQTLSGKTVALVFEKPSLRTRMSFAVGVHELGGLSLELLGAQMKNEEPEDSIRVLQGMVHGVMLRTFSHEKLERMATHARIPLINGLSDEHHPCQALADLLTIRQRLGPLRGKTICYLGDGNNVLHSLLLLAPKAGVNVRFACPKGYQPDAQILARAQVIAAESGAAITSHASPQEAAQGANALYTDVWTSMGFEAENEARLKAFAGYQINLELLQKAAPGAIVLHCLPMNKGQEITAEIVEHPNSALFQQAENRLHAQKALMVGIFGGS